MIEIKEDIKEPNNQFSIIHFGNNKLFVMNNARMLNLLYKKKLIYV